MQNHNIQIEIGAVLKSGFGATMKSSAGQLSNLGATIKQLENSAKSIANFNGLRASTLSAKKEWRMAQAQVKSLAHEISATNNPTKEMVANFDKAKNSATKAKQAYLSKREALHKLSTNLRQTGHDMSSLNAEQIKLGASIEKLKIK